ncbi:hypothetical protein AmaxDRAFT_1394 [Limnospira maxima CS-328]|uniref:Uncharacterized protein n=1 Tax=Limnospira maxima CS-328 TaxID=513049 RepID=B5VY02_LIMMA|nr:hypothetical protein AmaxDRAFT_1394 [Limnospira maxima CS-328]
MIEVKGKGGGCPFHIILEMGRQHLPIADRVVLLIEDLA